MTTLEKIREEIAEYGSIWVQYYIKGHTDTDIDKLVEDVLQQAKSQVLAVIDKYAEQEPKTGHWEFFCQHWRKCSECGYPHKFAEEWDYCPNCGVRMESEDKG